MGIILQTTTNAVPASTTLELVQDMELYYEFAKELSVLHKISYEPTTQIVEGLIEKIMSSENAQP